MSAEIHKGYAIAVRRATAILKSSVHRFGRDEYVSRPEIEQAIDILEEILDAMDCVAIPLPKKSAQENLTNAV